MEDSETRLDNLTKLLGFLIRLDDGKFSYQLLRSRKDAVMVVVRVGGQYWEIEFLTDGDVQIERFVSNGTIYSLSHEEDADLLDYLLTIYRGDYSALDYEAAAKQARQYFGTLFDEVVAIIGRHDVSGTASRLPADRARAIFIAQADYILVDLRFAESFQDARRIVTNRLHSFWVGHAMRQYDAVAREIWDAWKAARKQRLANQRRS